MPTGRVKWFDQASREARIVARSGREYPADTGEFDPQALAADAPVTFNLLRWDGVTRAVEVRLREGTRVSPARRRFGDLSGAKHPDSKGRAPLTHQRSTPGLDTGELVSRTVRRWVDALVTGDRGAALQFYAPACVIHAPSGTSHVGRKAVQEFLDRSALLGSRHHDVRIRGMGSRVRVTWPLTATDQTRLPASDWRVQTTLRIEHGQIAEQWG